MTEELKQKKRAYNKAYNAANAEKLKQKKREYMKAYRAANVENKREYMKAYYADNVQKKREYDKAYRAANVENKREYMKAYNAANTEKRREYDKAYNAANPERNHTGSTKHRALKLNRLHPDHDVEIEKSLYILAKNCESIFNEPFDIDHILPYDCGGMHHHENLQVIPARINRRKNNNPDYECNWPGFKTWKDLPDYLLIDKK